MSQSAKNILISVAVGLIIFLILAIGYNLKLIPISINVSNTVNSIQKQVDQLGIDFLGQIQIERAKMKDLAENSFIVDSFQSQVITDKVYSEVYEYTIRNKNCYGITFVNNEKTIFFVYPPYATKRKGMILATEYFNFFLTKEYSILPFQTSKEASTTDEIVLGYPIQKNGKILGLALFHYSGTSLLSEPIKKSTLNIKGLAFVKAYNMIVLNVTKQILEEKDRLSDIMATIEHENKTIGPVKVGNSKYYFFTNQIGKSGKQVVILPAEKVGTPLIVQVVISFYLITIIILITYVLLAFFFTPKEEEVEIKGTKYYKKPDEFEELKNKEEEEEFLSAISSEEKKKDFFFEEIKPEKPIDTALKSLVEEVSQKKSPLEVSLEEEYVFAPTEDLNIEQIPEIEKEGEEEPFKSEELSLEKEEENIELPEISTEQTKEEIELPQITIEQTEENIELPEIEEEEVIVDKEFTEKESVLPTLEDLEESKKEYGESIDNIKLNEELPEEIVSVSEEMKSLEEIEDQEVFEENIEEKLELPEIGEEETIKEEIEEKIELPEIKEEEIIEKETEEEEYKKEEEFTIPPLEEFSSGEEEKYEIEEEKSSKKDEFDFTELPDLEEENKMLEEEVKVEEEMKPLDQMEIPEFIEEKGLENIEEAAETEEIKEISEMNETEQIMPEVSEFEIPEEIKNIKEEMQPLDQMEIPEIEEIEEKEETIGEIPEIPKEKDINEEISLENEDLELPTIEDLDKEIPPMAISESNQVNENLDKMPEDFLENEPIGSISEELETEEDLSKKINEEENEFFGDISSDEISLSAEELENVAKVSDNVPSEDISGEQENIEDLELPKIDEIDFNETEEVSSTATTVELPYDDLCSSFVSKYNVDAIAFFKSEMDVFTCGGTSDKRFAKIQFEADEPIIEKLSSLRKDIFIPEGINKFQPLLQKDEELFSEFNAMYIHGIFDEGQLLGAIFIFTSSENQKDKEEYFHIASKLSELIA